MDAADLVLMTDPVAAIGHRHELLAKGTDNELRWVFLVVGLALNDVGNRCTVRRVESLIEFIKEVEWCRITT
jgi:hypothetical protein